MQAPTSYVNTAPKCEPHPSEIHGIGLFAREKIAAGEAFMTLPEGTIVPVSGYLKDETGLLGDEWNAISEQELLVRHQRTYYYFLNHQFAANAVVDISGRRVLALVDIEPHAEITLDYSREPLPQIYLELADANYLQKDQVKSRRFGQPCQISHVVMASGEGHSPDSTAPVAGFKERPARFGISLSSEESIVRRSNKAWG